MIICCISDSMILLGSIQRFELERILFVHLSKDQKIFIQDESEDEESRKSNSSSLNDVSKIKRSITPPPTINIIPQIKSRFFVSKVEEKKRSRSPSPRRPSIPRSVSLFFIDWLLLMMNTSWYFNSTILSFRIYQGTFHVICDNSFKRTLFSYQDSLTNVYEN